MPKPHNRYPGDPAAIVFDLDGVVMDSSTTLHHASWKFLFVEVLGISDFPLGHYHDHISGRQRAAGFTNYLEWRASEQGEDALLEVAHDQEQVSQYVTIKQDRVQELLRDPSFEIPVFADTISLVRQARDRGIPTTIASASENAPLLLAKTGLRGLFDEIAYGKSATVHGIEGELASKPEPDVFLASIAMVGAAPEDAIGVDDTVKGTQAVKAAGMMSVAVQREASRDLIAVGADLLVPSFRHYNIEALIEVFAKKRETREAAIH